MSLVTRLLATGCAVSILAAPANAQFGGMNLRGSTVGVAMNTPIGEFEQLVKTGFGIALRSGSAGQERWSGRSNFSFDTFNGTTIYENVQFITFGFDIVHSTRQSFYQFGGVSLMNSRFTARTGTAGINHRDQDFGLNGGVGVNWGAGEGLKGFVEFAATTVFTAGGNSAWFPVRLGIRF